MEHLFVYGTLQPGGPNEHILAKIEGSWTPATLQGKRVSSGWGAAQGYPGLTFEPPLTPIPGFVFSSARLQEHWRELDDFEGSEYRRVEAVAVLETGESVGVQVYAVST